MKNDRETERAAAAHEAMDRSDQVAASAAPQGDGVPDEGSVTEAATGGAASDAAGGMADATALQRQLDEQRDRYLRLAAEYDNFRKRTTRERAEIGPRAQGDLVRELLEGLDDLARFAHIDPATVDSQTLGEGVDLVERKLLKALTAAGMEIVDPLDQPFDPEYHEAIATEPAASREDDHTVGRVYQRGYRFKGQLLRPARVVVKQWNG